VAHAQCQLQQLARRLWIAGQIELDARDDDGMLNAHTQQATLHRGRHGREVAKCAVGREVKARGLKAQAARHDAFVQRAQRPVRIERQHDDVRLHEAHRMLEVQHQGRRVACHGTEQRAEMRGGRVRRDGTGAGGADQGDMRGGSLRQLRVSPALDGQHLVPYRPFELRHHEDSTFHSVLKHSDINRPTGVQGWPDDAGLLWMDCHLRVTTMAAPWRRVPFHLSCIHTMTSRLRILLLLCVVTACSRPRPVAPVPAPAVTVPPDTREASLFAVAVKHGTRTTTGVPGPNYWQQTAHYRIQATLDPQAQTLSGTETVMYVNHSPDTLTSLAIDLYQNINTAAAPKDQPVPTTAGLQLARVAAQGVTLQPQTTDSAVGYRVVNTIGRIQLPRRMLPGDSAELAFTWSFRIPPQANPRMGTDGSVFVLGYWYPQVAVYDDVAGWDTDPYVSRGEFYMDYGDYDVTITAPDDQLVTATGTLDNP